MPWLAADPVIVLPAHREALEALVRAHSTSQQLALRARMILHAADNIGVRESARELDVWPKTVRYWRGRWRQAPAAQSVSERLADAPRSGAPATYTPEQICAVIAMTCEKPSESERPISHWSQREIDRHGISAGEDWKRRRGSLISEADTVVFVLSPTSANSEICTGGGGEAAREPPRRREPTAAAAGAQLHFFYEGPQGEPCAPPLGTGCFIYRRIGSIGQNVQNGQFRRSSGKASWSPRSAGKGNVVARVIANTVKTLIIRRRAAMQAAGPQCCDTPLLAGMPELYITWLCWFAEQSAP